MRSQKFGVEIETKGLGLAETARVIAGALGGEARGTYVTDPETGKTWKAVPDGSLHGVSAEIVTPILTYDETPKLQEVALDRHAEPAICLLDQEAHALGDVRRAGAGELALDPGLAARVAVGRDGHAVGALGLRLDLGKDERGACRWSINLFRRVFPRQYARLRADGHVLRRPPAEASAKVGGR